MSSSAPARSLTDVNGIKLEILDWGGSGPAVVFLGGYANTPDFFEGIAERLTDRFRILGLCRRAHGASDQPETGYDTLTLANDIVGFLDAFGLDRASLVGHSFAGHEMCALAATSPDRIDKLVFVDALFRYQESDVELFGANPIPPAPPPPETFESVDAYCADFVSRYRAYRRLRSPRWDELWALSLERTEDGRYRERILPDVARQLMEGRFAYEPDYGAIPCPVLAIFAFQDETWIMPDDADDQMRAAVKAFNDRMDREFRRRCLEDARTGINDVRVVAFENTSHYCFLDRPDDTFQAINGFL